jgi:hypothetical protein
MTTTASDLSAAAETNDSPTASIAFWVLAAKVTSETGVFNCEHAGFWFPEWQAAEREVDAEIERGDGRTFDDAESALEYLRNL